MLNYSILDAIEARSTGIYDQFGKLCILSLKESIKYAREIYNQPNMTLIQEVLNIDSCYRSTTQMQWKKSYSNFRKYLAQARSPEF